MCATGCSSLVVTLAVSFRPLWELPLCNTLPGGVGEGGGVRGSGDVGEEAKACQMSAPDCSAQAMPYLLSLVGAAALCRSCR